MGGSNEKTIAPVTTKGADGKDVQIGDNIRFHGNEAEGTVHFHDSTSNLKAAIPTTDFFRNWGRWKTAPNEPLVLVDTPNKMKLTLKAVAEGGKLDVAGEVAKLEFGDGFKKLDDFANGK